MEAIYIVYEFNEHDRVMYKTPFKTYVSAVNAVYKKYKEELDRQNEECGDFTALRQIFVEENCKGVTNLYIEKGISIEIYRIVVAEAV